ncbi:MAG: BspA family leucine-rich repeat surface protein [Defluviitaleaceae bacterium]|nr:BspA family leucine-rich repeat surface protein [Defluviitaleaceae bacterium]
MYKSFKMFLCFFGIVLVMAEIYEHDTVTIAAPSFETSTEIASGVFTDGDGIAGAAWRLYDDGTLIVDAGFINVSGVNSPWHVHRDNIQEIIFTGPITAEDSLRNLFSRLSNVTAIEGLAYFDTSSVTDMAGMFLSTISLTSLDLSGWDTGSVTNMSHMFYDASGLTSLYLSDWNTGSVIDMTNMFWGTSSLISLDFSGWNTGNVLTMEAMLMNTSSLISLDLSGWNTDSVMTMRFMFRNASSLRQLVLGENFSFINTWDSPDLPNVPANALFAGTWQNVGTGTIDDPQGEYIFSSSQLMLNYQGSIMADTWVWRRINACTCYEYGCDVIHMGAFGNGGGIAGALWRLCDNGTLVVDRGFINWTDLSSPWYAHRNNIKKIIFTGPITAGTSLNNLFSHLSNVTAIEGLTYFDTSNVRNISGMFAEAKGLTSLYLSGWDTGSVTNMSFMFHESGLTSLDLSGWNTGNVTNMSYMFSNVSGVSGLTSLDLSGWNTGSVTDMSYMFTNANGLTSLDLSGWDTGRVTDMMWMFFGTSGLTSLDLSGWDTGNVEDMTNMFREASSLRQLVLDENFRFIGSPGLPDLPTNNIYTGRWQNVGTGTISSPQGEHIFTSQQLTAFYNNPGFADTWVWQKTATELLRVQLGLLIIYAQNLLNATHEATNGTSISANEYWATSEAHEIFKTEIENAKSVYNM